MMNDDGNNDNDNNDVNDNDFDFLIIMMSRGYSHFGSLADLPLPGLSIRSKGRDHLVTPVFV